MPKKLLGELLIGQGKIVEAQLQQALSHQKRSGNKIGASFVELGFITEKDLCKSLSESLRIPIIDVTRIDPSNITNEILTRIPLQKARAHRIVPLAIKNIRQKKRLVAATSDPTNYKFFDDLQFKSSLPLIIMIAPDSDIDWFIKKYYLGDAESVPENYAQTIQAGSPSEFLATIFEDAEFTDATRRHRKKID